MYEQKKITCHDRFWLPAVMLALSCASLAASHSTVTMSFELRVSGPHAACSNFAPLMLNHTANNSNSSWEQPNSTVPPPPPRYTTTSLARWRRSVWQCSAAAICSAASTHGGRSRRRRCRRQLLLGGGQSTGACVRRWRHGAALRSRLAAVKDALAHILT
eukprot:TRINITY_DN8693_c0_g1_i3.p1 TRINITY_DN8693_c0_g1~~TRINITY_DN8693_c0_g1_i3.p1  ORF type:complete len:160 (+),score=32.62 TRINITY_DN8693_c0_g1_i3:1273-1752(+)